ncbi:hypothetical protein KHC28_01390 [Ancylobacter sonchi]|uniref:DUF6876 family protein n=1 Tax=Ancylobacter sonchi TaxID=1937790 RepID=UPI001BD3164F|nr:DUF6876 family protein [Ancylobacter sonchi]MBS7532306.1 hypothetical protein [Ancylobacter sonchi]
MSNTPTFSTAALRQFTGTEQWYRHPLVRRVLFTDGAKFVADSAGAYWLLDEIAFAQHSEPAVARTGFQLWKLIVAADASADLRCEDGNGEAVYTKHLDWTDFTAEGVQLYFADNVILLPSEY